MSRRLPIYFVLDVSESMAGEPISEMETVMDSVLVNMRRDPHALESVWFSQIVFAAKPRMLSPLREITSFTPSALPIGGGTGIGEMLKFLMSTLKSDTQIDSATGKSDWKPIVYLMTDGRSTDSTAQAVSEWNSNYRNKCLLVAISIGRNSDLALLKSLTENVVVFMDSSPDAYGRFANWISRSVQASIRVASSPVHEKERPVAPFEIGIIETAESIENSQHDHDLSTVVLVGRCQTNRAPYLLRYSASNREASDEENYRFNGAVALKESYFELSGQAKDLKQVDVQELESAGKCISCGSEFALVFCSSCAAVSCGNSDQPWKCPWCNLAGRLGPLEGPGYTDRRLG
jgi:uncharacterized protein YegL